MRILMQLLYFNDHASCIDEILFSVQQNKRHTLFISFYAA